MNPGYYFISYLLFPLLILAILFFTLMRELIRIILILKHGNLFGGFLHSADAPYAVEDVTRNIITVVAIIGIPSDKSGNISEQIKQLVFEKVFKQPDLFPKLTSRCLRSMGFCYLLKNQITVDDCVFTLTFPKEIDRLNETLLQEIVSERSNQPLPSQGSILWEILVSPIPIQRITNKQQTTIFPLILRFSHIVGDGISLINLLNFFSDNNGQRSDLSTHKLRNIDCSFPDNRSITKRYMLSELITTVRQIFKFIGIVFLMPAIGIYETFGREVDFNSLHDRKLSGNKILVQTVEKERKLVPLVKKIKKSVPHSRFTDILVTAISGSLNNFFKNNSPFVPELAGALLAALMSAPSMDQNFMMQNYFSVALLELPIRLQSQLLKQRLREVMKQMNKLRNSPDFQVNSWLLGVFCGVVPIPLLRYAIQTDTVTMTISNIPGIPKLSILNGCEIEDITFHTHLRGTTGVGFSLLTYDDRFQIGLSVDKSLISSKEVAQSLVDDIFENINLLHEEIFSFNSSTEL